jgi:hypothetical protein
MLTTRGGAASSDDPAGVMAPYHSRAEGKVQPAAAAGARAGRAVAVGLGSMPPSPPARIFLLSPASSTGARARLLLREDAAFDLARRLRDPAGAPLGEVFSFVSGLYFRGKLAYARRFAAPPGGLRPLFRDGVLVITPGAGLQAPDARVGLRELRAFAAIVIAPDNPVYRTPLLAHARDVERRLPGDAEVVLLGSIASPRYLEPLAEVFGPRLRFPIEFVGRGDMSRGGLMLRCVAEARPLTYVPFGESVRHGPRPPRLTPRPRASARGPVPAGG